MPVQATTSCGNCRCLARMISLLTISPLVPASTTPVYLHASSIAPKTTYSARVNTIDLSLAEKCILEAQLILSLSTFIFWTLVFGDSTHSSALQGRSVFWHPFSASKFSEISSLFSAKKKVGDHRDLLAVWFARYHHLSVEAFILFSWVVCRIVHGWVLTQLDLDLCKVFAKWTPVLFELFLVSFNRHFVSVVSNHCAVW